MVNPLRKMRIIAVPLTRPNARVVPPNGTKLNRLTYYQFQISAKQKPLSTATDEKSGVAHSEETEKRSWLPEQGIVNWATGKAADIWAGFGKAEGGWKLKTYQVGEKLVDRMEFEELALKSIDPSLGPSITQLKRSPVLNAKEEPPKVCFIPLIFPPSILSPSSALSELRTYTERRVPRHRRGFYGWIIVAPITAPFMIIPIIPNLPFFFCVWRAWSHYRAYKASKYLQSLLEHDLIVPEPSEPLDAVYHMHKLAEPSPSSLLLEDPTSSTSSSSTSSSSSSSSPTPESATKSKPEPPHTVLLTRDSVPAILSAFAFKPDSTAAADMYRAVEQARVRVSSGRTEL
ncbi:hypothetical protein M413DRAFT_72320 [Hebeloma cylindrosporum]|uniref:Mitochondrial K+-H+ exchange-related-domain-containing protein n=1 Tax=Hebeloma cylindrosporum TaxID=76867 RepID=A0A0C3CBN5_HEBCY|nr:hypothetical protein M413DRAFT_72320 [Hebeloma cylindrosporum h7]